MKKTLFLAMLPSLSFAEGIDKKIDNAFAPISDFFSSVVFFTINDIPFVLMLLVFSALFFTIYFAFPNIRYFRVAVNTVRGKYDDLEAIGKYAQEMDIWYHVDAAFGFWILLADEPYRSLIKGI